MIVTLNPRDCSVKIDKKILSSEIDVNFINQLEMEVKQNPRLTKKFMQTLIVTQMAFASTLVKMPKIYAAAVVPIQTPQVDPDLLQIAIIIIGVVALLGVLIALISLMSASIWKMLFGGRQSDEWRMNIIKGLMQLLAAPVIVFLIVGIFSMVFGGNPLFKLILDPIKSVFQIG